MTAGEREELRRRIDARRREVVRVRCGGETGTIYENPESGYRQGCRCDFCSFGTRDNRRRRSERRAAA